MITQTRFYLFHVNKAKSHYSDRTDLTILLQRQESCFSLVGQDRNLRKIVELSRSSSLTVLDKGNNGVFLSTFGSLPYPKWYEVRIRSQGGRVICVNGLRKRQWLLPIKCMQRVSFPFSFFFSTFGRNIKRSFVKVIIIKIGFSQSLFDYLI